MQVLQGLAGVRPLGREVDGRSITPVQVIEMQAAEPLQPIEDRVNQLLAGSRADVVVKVFGPDLTVGKSIADHIGQVMRRVDGTGDLRVQRVLGLPMLTVRADRLRLARYGIPADEVLEVLEASRVGRNAGKIFEGPRRFDLTLLEWVGERRLRRR